jgi:hypothetical protein
MALSPEEEALVCWGGSTPQLWGCSTFSANDDGAIWFCHVCYGRFGPNTVLQHKPSTYVKHNQKVAERITRQVEKRGFIS